MRSDEAKLPEPPTNGRPVYDRPGDTWMCGNAGTDHACSNGPSRSGRCPLADACHPQQSWNGTRRRIMIAAMIVFLFAIGFAIRPGQAPDVFKPGALASPHAQILSSKLSSARCAACHRSASISPTKWFNPDAAGHQDVSQTDRCLDCHHQTINRDVAKFAHNLPPEVRKQIRARISLASARLPGGTSPPTWHDKMPSPAVDQNNLECSACHREHQGADADLLAVSDAQCQTCHADRFGSFAKSHPGWGQWPYGRGGEISFDHQSHLTKHFPATMKNGAVAKFDCAKCHQRDEDGEITRTVSYESGCQSCHDDATRIESAKGFDLLTLPTIPQHLSAASQWPESATGPLDGKVSPLANLLMRSDASAAESLRLIGESEFSSLNPDDPNIAAAIKEISAAHERLLNDLAQRGQVAIIQRLSESGITTDSLAEIVRNLPAQLLIEANREWFLESDTHQASRVKASRSMASSETAPSGQMSAIQQVGFNDEAKAEKSNGDSILLPLQPGHELYFAEPKTNLPKNTTQAPNKIAQVPLLPASQPSSDKLLEDAAVEDDLLADDLLQSDSSPSGDDEMGDDLLSDEMLVSDDLSGDEFDGELTGDLLAEHPLAADPLAEDLLAADPLAADPLSTDPLADDPLTVDPLTDEPLSMDPLATDPLAADPLDADPLDADPLGADPLAQSPAKKPKNRPTRFDAATMMPAGGWYRDPIRMSIAYRGNGHSDPVLRAAVELIGRLPPSDPVRKQMLESRSISTCVSCHTTAAQFRPSWHAQPLVGAKTEFTKFTHGPHLKIALLANCSHCHEVNTKTRESKDDTDFVRLASFASESARQQTESDAHEFHALKKQACASCHNTKAAGESCAKCHRYHIQQ